MKSSSRASFSHGHSRHHQQRWWFLIFLSLKPRPKCLDLLSKPPVLKSWSQGHQRRWFPPILLQREKDYQKKRKEKSTMRKEFTPFINMFSESAIMGFWVCWFFWVSVLLCFSIWLCWFFCFLFFFFFTSFDGHGGVVVVQWFLWDWWLLWWCVGSWMKYYFIVNVFVGSMIYYFIVRDILFYCDVYIILLC